MRTFSVALVALLVASSAWATDDTSSKALIAAAVASPARTDADRERDLREHPQEVMEFAGFKPGMSIGDIFGGAGYYSEIVAGIVGPKGLVRDVDNPPYDHYAKDGIAKRLADNRLANVRYEVAPTEAMILGHASLDGALMVMAYHDLYVSHPERGWPAADVGQFLDQLADALKSGAVLLVIDHAARPGSGQQDTQEMHRIDEQFARAAFEAHGFKLVGTLPVLRNPDDDHSLNVFDPAIRGKTDRFVHLYRKP